MSWRDSAALAMEIGVRRVAGPGSALLAELYPVVAARRGFLGQSTPCGKSSNSALVAQPPSRLFALINDIESYPQFLPWCTRAKVQSRSEREIVATVGVKRGPLHGEFTTRNDLEPDRRIRMHLVSGPFRMLEGEWLLTPIATAGAARS